MFSARKPREPAPGDALTTLGPAAPSENTSSDRTGPWTNHRRCFKDRAGGMAGRILLLILGIARSLGEPEPWLCTAETARAFRMRTQKTKASGYMVYPAVFVAR